MIRIPLRGSEYDILGPWRHVYCYTGRAGVSRYWKRQYRRRLRRALRQNKNQRYYEVTGE